MYKVFYENKQKGIYEEIYQVSTIDEAIKEILSFLKQYNDKIYYVRQFENEKGQVVLDVGSHYQFYYLEKI